MLQKELTNTLVLDSQRRDFAQIPDQRIKESLERIQCCGEGCHCSRCLHLISDFPSQLPANATSEAIDHTPSTWLLSPHGRCLLPHLALGIAILWKVNHQIVT